jgi:NDP-sugar pyrophosphorylase family protein
MELLKTKDLFDLEHTAAGKLLKSFELPHEALSHIKDFITELAKELPSDEYEEIREGVFIARDAKVAESAVILPPTIIGHRTEIRTGAFIRGAVLIGDDAVIGNSTEIKNAIIFDGVQLPHYNYVGDSILGYRSHLGAGAVISNFKLDHSNVNIRYGEESLGTGLRKFGAIIGDRTEIGCNSVIFPGSIIARDTLVYPLTRVRGVIPSPSVIKSETDISPRLI